MDSHADGDRSGKVSLAVNFRVGNVDKNSPDGSSGLVEGMSRLMDCSWDIQIYNETSPNHWAYLLCPR